MNNNILELKGQRPIAVRKGGTEEIYPCPSCGRPKLHINRQKGVWYCFREGRGGVLEGIPDYYGKWERGLLHDYFLPRPLEVEELSVPDSAIPLLEAKGIVADLVLEYLSNRGVTTEQIEDYCWLGGRDTYVGRCIFRSPNGYWVAKKVLGSGPNYLNPPGIRRPWITGLSNRYIVVEGVFDALAVERAGFEACALLGSSLTKEGRAFLVGVQKIVILLDTKTIGRAWKIYQDLYWFGQVKLLIFEDAFPGWKDPAEVPEQLLKEKLEKC